MYGAPPDRGPYWGIGSIFFGLVNPLKDGLEVLGTIWHFNKNCFYISLFFFGDVSPIWRLGDGVNLETDKLQRWYTDASRIVTFDLHTLSDLKPTTWFLNTSCNIWMTNLRWRQKEKAALLWQSRSNSPQKFLKLRTWCHTNIQVKDINTNSWYSWYNILTSMP